MIVRTLNDVKARGAYRENPGVWSSARYLLRDDAVGLTLTDTRVSAGQRQEMQYKNHFEANLIIAGEGRLTETATGQVHALRPGTMYALNEHDHHIIEADTDMHIVCVFTPALKGPETHDESGSYPLLED